MMNNSSTKTLHVRLQELMCTLFIASIIIQHINTLELTMPEQFAYTRPSTAFHLEIDESDSTQLLAAYVASLGEIRQNDTEPHKIVGGERKGYQDGIGHDAQFDHITGFAQLNMTHVALVDHGNQCIRMVDRLQRSATTLAGQCRQPGDDNGPLLQSKFYQPYSIIKRSDNGVLLVTDHHNNAIREIDLEAKSVSTFLRSESDLPWPIDLVFDEYSGRMLVTLRFKFVFIDSDKNVHHISDDRAEKIIMYSSHEMVMSDHHDDFERNGRKSRLKRVAYNHTAEQPYNITILLEWPTPNEPPLAIQFNKSDKRLFASERQVVRFAKFRVEAEGDAEFPKPTTTIPTTTIASTTSTTPSSAPRSTTKPDQTTTTIVVILAGHRDSTLLLYVGVAIGIVCLIVVIATVFYLKRDHIMRKRGGARDQRQPQWTTQASMDEDNNRNKQIDKWMDEGKKAHLVYNTIPADRLAERGREYAELGKTAAERQPASSAACSSAPDIEMSEVSGSRVRGRGRMRSDEKSLLSRQISSDDEVTPQLTSEDMLSKQTAGSVTNVAVLVEDSEEETNPEPVYNTAAYPYSRAFDHFPQPFFGHVPLIRSVQPSDAMTHESQANHNSAGSDHGPLPDLPSTPSSQPVPPADIVPTENSSTYLYAGTEGIYQSTSVNQEVPQLQPSIAFEEVF